jgi:hypothetical protein
MRTNREPCQFHDPWSTRISAHTPPELGPALPMFLYPLDYSLPKHTRQLDIFECAGDSFKMTSRRSALVIFSITASCLRRWEIDGRIERLSWSLLWEAWTSKPPKRVMFPRENRERTVKPAHAELWPYNVHGNVGAAPKATKARDASFNPEMFHEPRAANYSVEAKKDKKASGHQKRKI